MMRKPSQEPGLTERRSLQLDDPTYKLRRAAAEGLQQENHRRSKVQSSATKVRNQQPYATLPSRSKILIS